MVGHCALRYYAMGDRSLDPDVTPTDDDLDAMTRLVDEAMTAGALGFSSSRTLRHRVPGGRFVPGTYAEEAELLGLRRRARAPRPRRVRGGAPLRRRRSDAPARRVGARVDGTRERAVRSAAHVRLVAHLRRRATTTCERSSWPALRTPRAPGSARRPRRGSSGCSRASRTAHRSTAMPSGERSRTSPSTSGWACCTIRRAARQLVDVARDDREGLDVFYLLNDDEGLARYDCPPERGLVAIAGRPRRHAGRGVHRPRARDPRSAGAVVAAAEPERGRDRPDAHRARGDAGARRRRRALRPDDGRQLPHLPPRVLGAGAGPPDGGGRRSAGSRPTRPPPSASPTAACCARARSPTST